MQCNACLSVSILATIAALLLLLLLLLLLFSSLLFSTLFLPMEEAEPHTPLRGYSPEAFELAWL